MKVLGCGDQHLTKKKPKNRTDDYFDTVIGKFAQEFKIAQEEKCEVIVFPGDVFDTFREDHFVVQSVMDILIRYRPIIRAVGVAGQHDQQFHNPNLKGTALQTLITAGLFTILGEQPVMINGVDFYGSSWKCEIPEIINPERVNILAIHKMIVDEKLWAAQEGHTWANHMILKSGFDLIVSGDNHNQFTATSGHKHLVNMGSMMRSTIAQVNHTPAVTVYDTKTKEIEIIDLEVKPIDEVMCIEKAEKEKERNAQLDAFVASLKDNGEFGESGESRVKLDFVSALHDFIEENGIDADVAKILYEVIEQ